MSEPFAVDEPTQRYLLATAIGAVRARLEGRTPVPPDDAPEDAAAPGSSFVTLRDGSRLLGCVGSLTPHRSLADDVASNAVGSAFADPRLPALTPDEFVRMEVKISVLGPLEPVEVSSRHELLGVLRPGVDGLLVTAGSKRGTFLPSVWEQVQSPDEFLSMLWQKAGFRAGSWPRHLEVQRYGTFEFGEPGPRPPIRLER